MSHPHTCSECGAPLSARAPEGLCPSCLLKRGLESHTAGYTERDKRHGEWTPPKTEELAEKFPELEIIRLIGRGGMGAVYQARQKNLDRVVALKILPPEMGKDIAFTERFAREAQAMAKLNHPHIVDIYEFGERAGLYYFIMEYVDGVSLREVLNAGHMKATEALAVVPQICDALQYAHDQGIVHRDIKPENILLNKQGQVKIADFGLAKLMGQTGAAPEKVMGTPQYMAPEQRERPAEVDHRADIYALGVVFYQMLTGELPARQIEPPSRKVQIDVRLDEIVLRTLEREPQRRYQQASQLRTEVETFTNTQTPQAERSSPFETPHNASDHTGPARRSIPADSLLGIRLLETRGGTVAVHWPGAILAAIIVFIPAAIAAALLRLPPGSSYNAGEGFIFAAIAAAVMVAIGIVYLKRAAPVESVGHVTTPVAPTSTTRGVPATAHRLAVLAFVFASLGGLFGAAAWILMPYPPQPLVWAIPAMALIGIGLSLAAWRSVTAKAAAGLAAANLIIWLVVFVSTSGNDFRNRPDSKQGANAAVSTNLPGVGPGPDTQMHSHNPLRTPAQKQLTTTTVTPTTMPAPRLQVRALRSDADTTSPADAFPDPADPAKQCHVLKEIFLDELALHAAKVEPVVFNPTEFFVRLQFTPRGAEAFARTIRENPDRKFVVVLNGKLLPEPIFRFIKSDGTDVALVTTSREEADKLAEALNDIAPATYHFESDGPGDPHTLSIRRGDKVLKRIDLRNKTAVFGMYGQATFDGRYFATCTKFLDTASGHATIYNYLGEQVAQFPLDDKWHINGFTKPLGSRIHAISDAGFIATRPAYHDEGPPLIRIHDFNGKLLAGQANNLHDVRFTPDGIPLVLGTMNSIEDKRFGTVTLGERRTVVTVLHTGTTHYPSDVRVRILDFAGSANASVVAFTEAPQAENFADRMSIVGPGYGAHTPIRDKYGKVQPGIAISYRGDYVALRLGATGLAIIKSKGAHLTAFELPRDLGITRIASVEVDDAGQLTVLAQGPRGAMRVRTDATGKLLDSSDLPTTSHLGYIGSDLSLRDAVEKADFVGVAEILDVGVVTPDAGGVSTYEGMRLKITRLLTVRAPTPTGALKRIPPAEIVVKATRHFIARKKEETAPKKGDVSIFFISKDLKVLKILPADAETLDSVLAAIAPSPQTAPVTSTTIPTRKQKND